MTSRSSISTRPASTRSRTARHPDGAGQRRLAPVARARGHPRDRPRDRVHRPRRGQHRRVDAGPRRCAAARSSRGRRARSTSRPGARASSTSTSWSRPSSRSRRPSRAPIGLPGAVQTDVFADGRVRDGRVRDRRRARARSRRRHDGREAAVPDECVRRIDHPRQPRDHPRRQRPHRGRRPDRADRLSRGGAGVGAPPAHARGRPASRASDRGRGRRDGPGDRIAARVAWS